MSSQVQQSVSSADKVHPLDVFPQEVWLTLFDKLPIADLCSCFIASSSFRNWLLSKRTTFLAPEVIPILEFWLHGESQKIPLLLTCRLVSRSWKRSVDAHCESLEFFEKAHHNDVITDDDVLTITLNNTATLKTFSDSLKSIPKSENPFISRTILFQDEDDSDAEDFYEAIPNFLEVWGRHIWYCGINLKYPIHQGFTFIYTDMVKSYIKLLPNLKVLTFERDNTDENYLEDWDQLQELISSDPLPKIELVKLTMKLLPVLITRELLRAVDTPKLEFLNVSCVRECMDVPLTNATSLKAVIASYEGMPALRTLERMPWPLEYAELNVAMEADKLEDRITLRDLFDVLTKFGDTLQELRLTLWNGVKYGGTGPDKDLRLRLPNLRRLLVSGNYYVEIRSIDFLHGLGKLESFKLDMSSYCLDNLEENVEEVIKFSGCMERMMESNVWEELPRLQSLKIKRRDKAPLKYWRKVDA